MKIAGNNYNNAISLLLFFTLLHGEKSIELHSISSSIKVDGIIELDEWSNAQVAEGFVEIMPRDNFPSLTNTKVLVTYDKEYLYLAFYAIDNPKKIRATQSKRDDIEDDDRVGVILDPRNDGIVAYTFSSNAYGNQHDGQKFGDRDRKGWDALWLSAGRLTDSGYEVEMGIPFSIFGISDTDDFHWRISFFRIVPRNDSERLNFWTSVNRNDKCDICQLGHLYGIKDINAKAPIELLPSIIGSYEDKIFGDIGLGVSFPIAKETTVEITFNPDFSQVESNATKIDLNSQTSLSYRETRPFFNEGIDLFNMGSGWKPKTRAVYTRSINQPIVASKILGHYKNIQYGYLGAIDQNSIIIVPFKDFGDTSDNLGKSITNIFRGKYIIKNGSYLGSILSDKRYKDGSGTLGGIDGIFRFNDNLKLDWQLLLSKTNEPNDTTLSTNINGYTFDNGSYSSDFDKETYSGHGLYLSLESEKRNNSMTLMYAERSSTFRADNGYIDFNDRRNVTINRGISLYPENTLFEKINFWLGIGRIYFYDWSPNQDWIYIGHSARMLGQLSYDIALLAQNEIYKGIQFYNNYSMMFELEKDFSKNIAIEIEPQFGTEIIREDVPYQARNISLGAELNIKLMNRIKLNFKLDQSQSMSFDSNEEIYSDQIFRLKFEYQKDYSLNFRLVTQYHKYYQMLDIQPLISYQPGPFTIFYVGTSISYERVGSQWLEDYAQVYVKAQKLFSI